VAAAYGRDEAAVAQAKSYLFGNDDNLDAGNIAMWELLKEGDSGPAAANFLKHELREIELLREAGVDIDDHVACVVARVEKGIHRRALEDADIDERDLFDPRVVQALLAEFSPFYHGHAPRRGRL
jgi:hypothetical protein